MVTEQNPSREANECGTLSLITDDDEFYYKFTPQLRHFLHYLRRASLRPIHHFIIRLLCCQLVAVPSDSSSALVLQQLQLPLPVQGLLTQQTYMATSQHPMPHGSHLLLLSLALALLLFVGSADAGESYEKCPKGYKDCDKYKPGCETNVLSDPKNCGYCGKKCEHVKYADVECHDGYCKYTCNHGWTNCDKKWDNGCEVDTNTDAHNCGWCGHVCHEVKNADSKCKNGQCEPECKKGWGNCDGKIKRNGCETDLSNDVSNCGECGHQCPCGLKGGEPTCSHGKCGVQCKKGSKYEKSKKGCVPEPKY